MATLRKPEFFNLEIAGKVRTYHGLLRQIIGLH